MAKEPDMNVNQDHVLKVLTDDPARRMVEKLFKRHVRGDSAGSRYPAFLIGMDRLMYDHGGAPADGSAAEESDPDDYADDMETNAPDADAGDAGGAEQSAELSPEGQRVRAEVAGMLRRLG